MRLPVEEQKPKRKEIKMSDPKVFTVADLDALAAWCGKAMTVEFPPQSPLGQISALVAYCEELRRVLKYLTCQHRGWCGTKTLSSRQCTCGYDEARRLLGDA